MERALRRNRVNIVAIIEAAGKAGVKHLKFGDLEISFEEQKQEVAITRPTLVQAPIPTPEQQEASRRERQQELLEQLKIEDPLEYERLVALEG